MTIEPLPGALTFPQGCGFNSSAKKAPFDQGVVVAQGGRCARVGVGGNQSDPPPPGKVPNTLQTTHMC